MKTEHTLRYLLLRHLKTLEAFVPRQRFLDVTRSLTVTADRDRYIVTWRAAEEPRVRIFDRSEFVFYRRGDTDPQSRTVDENLVDDNDALARAFAQDALGVGAAAPGASREAVEPYSKYRMVAAAGLAVAMGTAGGLPLPANGLLFVLCLVEHLPAGRLWAAGLFVALGLVGPSTATVLSASVYGILQLLDPNAERRGLRIGLCGAAVVAGVVGLFTGLHPPARGLGAVVAVWLATISAGLRSLFDSHFRALPLALPFYCAGLYVDGYVAASLIGLSYSLVATVATAYIHRCLPLQRERTLTPNG